MERFSKFKESKSEYRRLRDDNIGGTGKVSRACTWTSLQNQINLMRLKSNIGDLQYYLSGFCFATLFT